jgi:hypothetical protein
MKSFFKEGLGAIGDAFLGVGYLLYLKLQDIYDWFNSNEETKDVLELMKNPTKFLVDKIGEAFKEFFKDPGKYIKSKLKLSDILSILKSDKLDLKNVFNFGAGKFSWKVSDIMKVWESDKLKLSSVFNLPKGSPWKLTDIIDTPKIDLKINLPDPAKAGKDMGNFIKKALDYAWDNVIEKSKALEDMAKLLGLKDPDAST